MPISTGEVLTDDNFISVGHVRHKIGQRYELIPLPEPPSEIKGRVTASSPDSTQKFAGRSRRISMICDRFPDASLIATMFSQSLARRKTVGR